MQGFLCGCSFLHSTSAKVELHPWHLERDAGWKVVPNTPKSALEAAFSRILPRKRGKKVMIFLPSDAFVSPLPSGCECQVQKKGMRRSSAVSSAAVRHSPSDPQPKTALSLLERRTIPRVEEGPGGWVGRVCVCACRGGRGGRGGKDGGCFGPLCKRSTEAVRMETPVRAGGLSRPETTRTPKLCFDNDRPGLCEGFVVHVVVWESTVSAVCVRVGR